MTNRLPRAWTRFFTENEISIGAPPDIPEKPSDRHQLIVVPQGIDINHINEIFKKKLSEADVHAFIAPGKLEGAPFDLSDLIHSDDRSPKEGSYSFWVRSHVAVRGKLVRVGEVSPTMTVLEALLYHVILMQRFGAERYLEAHGLDYVHPCRGTRGGKRGATNQTPSFRFDLQDYKVCLDWLSKR